MRIPTLSGLILASGVLACGEQPVAAPSDALASLRVEGRVLDDSGTPVVGGYVWISFWYSPDSKEESSAETVSSVGTQPDGTFALHIDGLEGAAIDSIRLHATGPGCSTTGVVTVIPRAGLPEGPDGVLTLDLPSGPAPEPVVTAIGQVCAVGDHPLFGIVADMSFALRIDSLYGELVYGRWAVVYRHSAAGPQGQFQGVQRASLLVLALTPVEWPYPGCTQLRLAIPIGAAGAWGKAGILYDDGCLPERDDLIFVPETQQTWIPP